MLPNIAQLIICSFIIFVVFWSVGFTKELSFVKPFFALSLLAMDYICFGTYIENLVECEG